MNHPHCGAWLIARVLTLVRIHGTTPGGRPGRYDAELNMDCKAMRPDGKTAATLMPSAFGLAGVNHHTWTGGWGTVTYWNAYVANTQMHGDVLRSAVWMTPSDFPLRPRPAGGGSATKPT
jgi:hypothetical protein